MSMMMLTGRAGNAYQMDSLAFPHGHLPDNDTVKGIEALNVGKVDVLMSNPPFGSDIPFSETTVLDRYRDNAPTWGVAWSYSRRGGELLPSTVPAAKVAPEQLFVQRDIEWVKPGGRLGIVLPNGILSNPGPSDEAVRRYILQECWVMASVELPVEAFIYEAGVNILTTLLFLRRKTAAERQASLFHGGDPDYPVFMAVAGKVGVDRRGNEVFVRTPEGDKVFEPKDFTETLRFGGVEVPRRITRQVPVIDDDLPRIAQEYHAFVARHRRELPWETGA